MRRLTLLAVLAVLAVGCGDDSSASDADWWSAPPDGTRWVGYGDVVVAVPDWWTTGETQCGAPVEDTVYFDTGAVYDCSDPADPATVQEVSALAVLDADHGYGEYVTREMEPVGDVLERSGCEEWFEGVCRRMFVLPGSDTVFAVTIAEEGDGDYEAIRDSARELPEGVTTVPLAINSAQWTPTWGAEPRSVRALTAAIEDAGLVVEVETVDPDPNGDVADLPPGSLLDVEPALGTPIEVGGTVKVTVMGTSGP